MSSNAISAQGSSIPLPSSEQSFSILDFPDELLLGIIEKVSHTNTLLRIAGTNRRLRWIVDGGEVKISTLVKFAMDEGVRKRSRANAQDFPVCPPAPRSIKKARSRFAR